jgi:hypothetical protein
MGAINDYFDKSYCINLDRRPDRWEENCLPQFNKLGLEVERFSATDGQLLDLNHDKPYKGELAGSMSHLNAIKKAKEEGIDKLFLLEDDVVFADNVNDSFSKLINNVPKDWDILFFGGNHIGGFQPISQGVVKLGRSYAIHACGISSKAYDIMITHLENKINNVLDNKDKRFTPSVAADYFLADLHKVLNVYCFRPHLAWQLDGYSDIQHSNVNYNFLK